MRTRSRLLALVLTTIVLAGCSTSATDEDSGAQPTGDSASSSPEGAQGETLDIQTSLYPITFLVERIGAEHVAVTSLAPAGAEPHDLELSPAQVSDLTDADLLIYLSGFQPAVDDAVAVVSPTALDLAPDVHLIEPTGEEHTETGDAHDHGDLDPHFWLDPQRMTDAAEAIASELAATDPANASAYTDNLASLRDDLTALDERYADTLATCESTTLVTSHEAFGYLADRYGLEQVGIAGLDPEAETSPARLREITDVIEETGTTTIFTESLLGSSPAQVVASDLGISAALLDPIESITDQSPGADYLGVMDANLDSLRTGLGCS